MRAAVAERADLGRHRERLLATRERLRAELDDVEAALRELDERDALLDRLAGPVPERPVARPAVGPGGATPLRGPAIRRVAVEVLRARPDRPQALHYRDWFEALRAAGYAVAGKDPLAVFLTQLSRSPVVRRGTQSGVYELDPAAPRRLRDRLERLHAELRGLTAAPSPTADLTAIRARRAALTTEITRVEKALEEAEAVLGAAAGPVAAAG
jgi:chaperonin cofactor prefoldin